MKPVPVSDLPPHLQEQVRKQLGMESQQPALAQGEATTKRVQSKGPTKTEAAYARHLQCMRPNAKIIWNGISLRMDNGHRYTPDYVVIRDYDMPIELHEVKGSYRLGSLQRSRLAFDQARIEWPNFVFVWAQKEKSGRWDITEYITIK